MKLVNLFLRDAELNIKYIYFYPLNGVIRLCQVKQVHSSLYYT